MPTDDTAALLRACRAGDAAAWEVLVRRYQRLIYAIPRRAGLGEDLVADVFQRVFVTLIEHIDRIDRPDRLGAWLATTARRETWRQLRRERATASIDDSNEDSEVLQIADTELLPDEIIEQLEQQHAVRLAMDNLDPRCRTLIRLLFFQEKPPAYSVIATELSIPEGSIGPTRARCLRKLQQILEARER